MPNHLISGISILIWRNFFLFAVLGNKTPMLRSKYTFFIHAQLGSLARPQNTHTESDSLASLVSDQAKCNVSTVARAMISRCIRCRCVTTLYVSASVTFVGC